MKNHRADLKNIARRAMIERGLLPDFSAAAMAELARIQTAATDGTRTSVTSRVSSGRRSTTTIPETSTNSPWLNHILIGLSQSWSRLPT